jgi:acetylornithine deacetylase/succinyl-diaminopimelate desuccinylase-like protein
MLERLRVSDREIADAVAGVGDEMLELLARLVEAPTTFGNEEPGQELIELAYRDLLGLEPIDIAMDAEALRAHPLASPFSWDVSGKRNVVVPAVCIGPHAEHIHGVDERVFMPSVVQTAQVLALLVRDWCGLA